MANHQFARRCTSGESREGSSCVLGLTCRSINVRHQAHAQPLESGMLRAQNSIVLFARGCFGIEVKLAEKVGQCQDLHEAETSSRSAPSWRYSNVGPASVSSASLYSTSRIVVACERKSLRQRFKGVPRRRLVLGLPLFSPPSVATTWRDSLHVQSASAAGQRVRSSLHFKSHSSIAANASRSHFRRRAPRQLGCTGCSRSGTRSE